MNVLALILPVIFAAAFPIAEAEQRPRVIVMTDIGSDPDDQQSLVRLLVYSNEFEIEGLIATSRLSKNGFPRPDLIRRVVRAYGKVRGNLVLHNENYPDVPRLLSVVKEGTRNPGPETVKKNEKSETSAHIIAAINRPDPRPIWILIRGGAMDLALALTEIKRSRNEEEISSLISKLRVYAIGDQDGTVSYLKSEFPDLFLINPYTTSAPHYSGLTRGMYRNEVGGMPLVKDYSLVSVAWAKLHITKGHGALGARYPLNALQTPKTSRGVKEGDTPSMLYLLSETIGLSDTESPAWGSWGGRFTRTGPTRHFKSAFDEHWSGSKNRELREEWTVARFRPQYQSDFRARMDWCVKSYAEANHRPYALIDNQAAQGTLSLAVKAGQKIRMSSNESFDPDGNGLKRTWYIYKEAGTHKRPVRLQGSHSPVVEFTAPKVKKPQTLHLILELTDNGVPELSSYRRIVFNISSR